MKEVVKKRHPKTNRKQLNPAVSNATGPSEVLSPAQVANLIAQVKQFAEPLCNAEGMELVHVEFQRETTGRILRLYIDKPGGVGLEDCVSVSRQLGDFLDAGLSIETAYNLEVTSPGPERPLVKPSDFDRFKGRMAKLKINQPIEGRKNFKGVLLGIVEGQIGLMVDQKTVLLSFADIIKARLTPE